MSPGKSKEQKSRTGRQLQADRRPPILVNGKLSSVQARVAREIVAFARRENLVAGDPFRESVLAERIGISRTPVNVALRHLADRGVLVHDPHRGYFLNCNARELQTEHLFEGPDEPLYLKIADERLSGKLSDQASEASLMRRYKCSRSVLRNVLSRIQQEGWVERQLGNGWQFTGMIDSPEAYEESYLFRSIVEPAALLTTSFRPDPDELVALQRRQQFIADGGFETMTSIELFETTTEFHETLMKWSGNRFMAHSVRRINQLRRLVEYRQARHHRKPRQVHAQEHVAVLDAIARQDTLRAASLLREHLDRARRTKTYAHHIFEKEDDRVQLHSPGTSLRRASADSSTREHILSTQRPEAKGRTVVRR